MSYPPEPWHVKSHPDANITLIGNDKGWVFYLTHNDEFLPEIQEASARRIVACVNACEGIPTEALEDGVVRELIEALQAIKRIDGRTALTMEDADAIHAKCLSALAKVVGSSS
jgi:hypothetical protein